MTHKVSAMEWLGIEAPPTKGLSCPILTRPTSHRVSRPITSTLSTDDNRHRVERLKWKVLLLAGGDAGAPLRTESGEKTQGGASPRTPFWSSSIEIRSTNTRSDAVPAKPVVHIVSAPAATVPYTPVVTKKAIVPSPRRRHRCGQVTPVTAVLDKSRGIFLFDTLPANDVTQAPPLPAEHVEPVLDDPHAPDVPTVTVPHPPVERKGFSYPGAGRD